MRRQSQIQFARELFSAALTLLSLKLVILLVMYRIQFIYSPLESLDLVYSSFSYNLRRDVLDILVAFIWRCSKSVLSLEFFKRSSIHNFLFI